MADENLWLEILSETGANCTGKLTYEVFRQHMHAVLERCSSYKSLSVPNSQLEFSFMSLHDKDSLQLIDVSILNNE